MRENWLLLVVTAIVGALLSSGCVAPARRLTLPRIADSHIIFNPGWNTPVVAGADRDAWPVVLVSDETDPEAFFRETVIDRQGNSRRGRDYYYRRVESTRVRQSGR